MNKAIFLDRDGTVIEETGYLYQADQLRFLPGAISALRIFQDNGYSLVIVTNQAGVAYGLYSEEDVLTVHRHLTKELEKEGIHLSAIYYSPYHEAKGIGKYKIDHPSRKPHPGMLHQGAEEHNIDLSQSWMIGDRQSDIGAGYNAGCRTVLVCTGYGGECLQTKADWQWQPDLVCKDLFTAAKEIINI